MSDSLAGTEQERRELLVQPRKCGAEVGERLCLRAIIPEELGELFARVRPTRTGKVHQQRLDLARRKIGHHHPVPPNFDPAQCRDFE